MWLLVVLRCNVLTDYFEQSIVPVTIFTKLSWIVTSLEAQDKFSVVCIVVCKFIYRVIYMSIITGDHFT